MLPGKTPKQLHEVSGLFLSREKSQSAEPPVKPDVTVILAVLGEGPCRAFIASGIGAAFASQGVKVSLLETGNSLPNLGYYFALEAARYLASTLNGKRVVEGAAGHSLRYFSAREPGLLGTCGGPFPRNSAPHLIVTAFDSTLPRLDSDGLQALIDVSSRFRKSKIEGNGTHAAAIIFVGRKGTESARELAARCISIDPDAPVFLAHETAVGAEMEAWKERGQHNLVFLEIPADLMKGLARRVPPTGRFFQEIVVNLLEVVGSRIKREKLDDRS